MFRPSDLISTAYVGEQRILHARPNGYGGKGHKWATGVIELAKTYDCISILDYGCGQGALVTALRQRLSHAIRLDEYDPAIEGKDELPSFADLVVCTDVLEHVEPERLDMVLRHLEALARKALFLVVATRPSGKWLSDGRNAHVILESAEWWADRVAQVIGWTSHVGPVSPLAKPSREWVTVWTP